MLRNSARWKDLLCCYLHDLRFTAALLRGLVTESLIKRGNDLSVNFIVKVNLIGKKEFADGMFAPAK